MLKLKQKELKIILNKKIIEEIVLKNENFIIIHGFNTINQKNLKKKFISHNDLNTLGRLYSYNFFNCKMPSTFFSITHDLTDSTIQFFLKKYKSNIIFLKNNKLIFDRFDLFLICVQKENIIINKLFRLLNFQIIKILFLKTWI